jgi:hypothetical protein
MTDHLLTAVYLLLSVVAAAVLAAAATSVRLLPEVIDISIVLTGAGLGALAFTTLGALRRFDPDRIARLSLGGTVVGGVAGAGVFFIALVIDVL